MRIKVTEDLLSGALFLGLGAGGAIIASGYKFGTAMRMGPGFFPVFLGGLIALLGISIIVRALRQPDSSPEIAHWELQPLFFVLLAIIAFSLLISDWGLIPAVLAVVLVGAPACRESGFVELGVIAVTLCAITTAIFVYGLNIPIRLGPW